jgi:hypothetical protein
LRRRCLFCSNNIVTGEVDFIESKQVYNSWSLIQGLFTPNMLRHVLLTQLGWLEQVATAAIIRTETAMRYVHRLIPQMPLKPVQLHALRIGYVCMTVAVV